MSPQGGWQDSKRGILRRSSAPNTNRRVRFEFQGQEVLPNSSPPAHGSGALTDAAIEIQNEDKSFPSKHPSEYEETSMPDSEDEEECEGTSLLDVEGEEDRLPRSPKVSSTKALRALSKQPLDPTEWDTINGDSDDELEEDSFPSIKREARNNYFLSDTMRLETAVPLPRSQVSGRELAEMTEAPTHPDIIADGSSGGDYDDEEEEETTLFDFDEESTLGDQGKRLLGKYVAEAEEENSDPLPVSNKAMSGGGIAIRDPSKASWRASAPLEDMQLTVGGAYDCVDPIKLERFHLGNISGLSFRERFIYEGVSEQKKREQREREQNTANEEGFDVESPAYSPPNGSESLSPTSGGQENAGRQTDVVASF